jgi:hypothetical protein
MRVNQLSSISSMATVLAVLQAAAALSKQLQPQLGGSGQPCGWPRIKAAPNGETSGMLH